MENCFDFASAGVIRYAHTCGILPFDTPIPLRIRSGGMDLTSTVVTSIRFTGTRFAGRGQGLSLFQSQTRHRATSTSISPSPSMPDFQQLTRLMSHWADRGGRFSDSERATVWQKSPGTHSICKSTGLPGLHSDLLLRTGSTARGKESRKRRLMNQRP